MCKNFKPFSLLAGRVFYGVTSGLGALFEKVAEKREREAAERESTPNEPGEPSACPTR